MLSCSLKADSSFAHRNSTALNTELFSHQSVIEIVTDTLEMNIHMNTFFYWNVRQYSSSWNINMHYICWMIILFFDLATYVKVNHFTPLLVREWSIKNMVATTGHAQTHGATANTYITIMCGKCSYIYMYFLMWRLYYPNVCTILYCITMYVFVLIAQGISYGYTTCTGCYASV